MDPSHAARFRAIVSYWDTAEAEIKRCELLQHSVAIAAVNELRYAGRRLADALLYATAPPGSLGLAPNVVTQELGKALLDAEQYCQRAHHDAIDSQVFFVREYLDLLVARVGHGTLVVALPNYLEIRQVLVEIAPVIVQSRQDRLKRVDYYARIATEHLPRLHTAHATLETSKDILFKIKRRDAIIFYGGILALILAVPALYAAFATHYHWWPFLAADPAALGM